jgi:uncharacterized membrane protein YjjP (DUF1212 family)
LEQGEAIATRSREPLAAADVLALLAATARLLFTNGETTRRMMVGVERLGAALGVNVAVLPRWGALTLRIDDPNAPRLESITAEPLGVDMTKVSATNDLIDQVCDHRIGAGALRPALAAINHLDTSINGLLLAGSRVVGGRSLPIFAWSELASAEWLALGI